jgi:hypothetical protein
MIHLARARHAWGTPDFDAVLKQEIEQLDAGLLPLQQGLTGSSVAMDGPVEALVISSAEVAGTICVKAGLFYAGIIAGCSCADDPTPVEPQPEYCVVRIDIDKATGVAAIALLAEG